MKQVFIKDLTDLYRKVYQSGVDISILKFTFKSMVYLYANDHGLIDYDDLIETDFIRRKLEEHRESFDKVLYKDLIRLENICHNVDFMFDITFGKEVILKCQQ
tara:strand:- start:176364 stop:176672 length:309 start_codon:yes stop_codon:yes gene_type:complete